MASSRIVETSPASLSSLALVSCSRAVGGVGFTSRTVCQSSIFTRAGRLESGRRLNCQPAKRVVSVASAVAAAQPSVSLKNAEKSIQLPIDYYQVLGAESHYTADAIVKAYQVRVSNPPTEGFSQETLRARQQILKVACDTLADRDLREEYDNGLKYDESGTLVVEVPWSKVPGALCLLQEAGEAEVVLQVGEALLDEQLKKPFRQDMMLVMALAYVELSREAMAETPPAVVRSCDLLNAALKLLQDGGSFLAPALREQIYETLEEITPRCVLELLSLPLDEEHKAQRTEGLQETRSILWTAGEGGLMAPVGRFSREQFLKEAFSRMTASEQVAVFKETPSTIPAEKLEVYSVALAHVAEGFRSRKPHLIEEAKNLFAQLHQSIGQRGANGLITDEQRDVILGQALSALLLGEVDNCKTCLGLNDVNSPVRCPEVVEFVLSNSDQNEDNELLSGMCKLLESWLAEEVFANFRETTGMQVTLSDYFDNPEVLDYLDKLEKGASPLEAAAAIVRLEAALDSVKTTFHKVFPLRKPDDKVHNKNPPSEDVHDESSVVSYDEAYANSVKDKGRPKRGLVALQLACVGALVGGVVLANLQYPALRRRFWRLQKAPIVAAISSTLRKGDNESSAVEEIPKMNARLAEQLIRKWQLTKSQALGTNHAVAQLTEVLDGQMLKSWTERAVEVAKHGWYWEYSLLGLSIDSVTISEDGRRATVEATLQEAARLYSKNPQQNDSYKSSYTTRYGLQYGDSGWKITDGALLRT